MCNALRDNRAMCNSASMLSCDSVEAVTRALFNQVIQCMHAHACVSIRQNAHGQQDSAQQITVNCILKKKNARCAWITCRWRKKPEGTLSLPTMGTPRVPMPRNPIEGLAPLLSDAPPLASATGEAEATVIPTTADSRVRRATRQLQCRLGC